MNTKIKYIPPTPYGMHDSIINGIFCTDDTITFTFEDGITKIQDSYPQVEGKVILEEVDFDFCDVHILSPDGAYGKFSGEKLNILEFLKKYEWVRLEVVDEMYGFHELFLSGLISLKDNDSLVEINLFITFAGNMNYETNE